MHVAVDCPTCDKTLTIRMWESPQEAVNGLFSVNPLLKITSWCTVCETAFEVSLVYAYQVIGKSLAD